MCVCAPACLRIVLQSALGHLGCQQANQKRGGDIWSVLCAGHPQLSFVSCPKRTHPPQIHKQSCFSTQSQTSAHNLAQLLTRSAFHTITCSVHRSCAAPTLTHSPRTTRTTNTAVSHSTQSQTSAHMRCAQVMRCSYPDTFPTDNKRKPSMMPTSSASKTSHALLLP